MKKLWNWIDEYHDLWFSKKGRYQLSWNTTEFVLGVALLNGGGGFSIEILSFELTRWKGSAEKVAEGRRCWMLARGK